MTIKKSNNGAVAAGASAGGAAIADRFKLAPTAPSATATVSKKSAMWALIAALVATAASAILTYTLYKHWDFLMPV